MKALKTNLTLIKSYITIARIQKLLFLLKIINFCFFGNDDKFFIVIQLGDDLINLLKKQSKS